MKSATISASHKNQLRTAFGPLLPFIRFLRILPARLHAGQQASKLRSHKTNTSICYLTNNFPNRPALRTEIAGGGAVKLTFLAESFPHSYPNASILYTVSSVDHFARPIILRTARQKGLKVVLNQNGVAYLAWHGPGWEEPNKKLRAAYEQADFIVYQSNFCKESARIFLGESSAPSQVIYNPVDTNLYQPVQKNLPRRGPVLLLGGNQYERYRLESAIQIFKQITTHLPDAHLLITGRLWGDDQNVSMAIAKQALLKLGIEDLVEFTGSYTQASAPLIFQRADILIHTKYNDPSPNLIAESLASGLPVVYSASGGVPELVGKDAGIGLPVEQSWEKISLPDTQAMALAAVNIWENYKDFSNAARQQAEQQFALDKFILAHRELFSSLMDR